MFVLAIDTSSAAVVAGVASVENGGLTVIANRGPVSARGHGELLAPSIDECLHEAGLAPAEIGAVVAGVGPGPFTGLRVGLVTAAAFADAIGAPAYGACSLDAIAAAAADEQRLIVAADARRREVYWAQYSFGERIGEPAVGRLADVPVDRATAFAGAGAEMYADVWPRVPRRPDRYPAAGALVAQALDRIIAGAPAEPLTPLYLRRPDAVVPGAPKSVSQWS